MKEFFQSKKFKVIICILALLIGVMLYSGTKGGSESGSSFFGRAFAPIQSISANLSSKVESSLGMLTNASQYYEDNKRLKEQLGEQYNQIIDYDKIKRENEQLRQVIGLKEQFPDYVFSPPCAIIAKTTNDPFGSFIIDKGSDDDISLNDPVITADGLVGVVVKVSKTYSRVQTILSPDVPVGAYCIRTKDPGVVEGNIKFAEDGLCKMQYIDRNSDIKKGDIIVTSGNSGLFPVDRMIGTVQDVAVEDSGLSLYATIDPIVDINAVTNVFVITSFNGQGEGYEN